MEKELTKKIAESIKKKLKELLGFVPEGLPDYVMIMVANKKSRAQMEEDLSLFLIENNKKFVDWLMQLLQDVKQSDSGSKEKEEKPKTNKISKKSVEKDTSASKVEKTEPDEDVLALDYEHGTDDLLSKEIVEAESVSVSDDPKIDSASKQPSVSVNETAEIVKTNSKADLKCKTSSLPEAVNENHSDFEGYDPLYPELLIPSTVKTVGKKFRTNANQRGSKVLLMKAVEEANASIVGKDNMNCIYRPTPIKVLVAKNRKLKKSFQNFNNVENEEKELESDEDYEPVWCEQNVSIPRTHNNLLYPPVVDSGDSVLHVSAYPSGVLTRRKVLMNNVVDEDVELALDEDYPSETEDFEVDEPHSASTSFLVTLDGIDENTFRQKKRTLSTSFSDKSGDEMTENEVSFSTKKQKLNERCRYWPACKNGDQCEYHHPSIACKLFPNCKYGDKCMYIHPNCKFDSLCTRKDCPYTHVKKRDSAQITHVSNFMHQRKPKKLLATSSLPPLCKFFPNCSAYKSCPFLHPNKTCRFGMNCQSLKCPYIHPEYPSRKQLRWTANS